VVDPTGLLVLLALAFLGGAAGAAVGGRNAFALGGLAVVVGELAALVGGGPPDGTTAAELGASGLTAFAIGAPLGPHIVLGGGAAAAAYAARKGYLDQPYEYHYAKAVDQPLGARIDALLAGGAFGVLGVVLAGLSAGTLGRLGGSLPWPGLPWDPLSAAVVLSALAHRVAFGYPLLGEWRAAPLDARPFARGERRSGVSELLRADGVGTDAKSDGVGRYVVEPWLPHQYEWQRVALVGAATGALAAIVTALSGSPFLAFGLAAAALLADSLDVRHRLNLNLGPVPVTYHVALPVGVLVSGLPTGGGGLASALVWLAVAVVAGVAMGVLAAVVGEVASRLLYAQADTHLDPGFAAIIVTSFLLAVLDVLGLLSQDVIATLGL
jgi:hypothetical protein